MSTPKQHVVLLTNVNRVHRRDRLVLYACVTSPCLAPASPMMSSWIWSETPLEADQIVVVERKFDYPSDWQVVCEE